MSCANLRGDVGSSFFKKCCYFSFLKYFLKSATSYTVIKNISQFFIISRNIFLETWMSFEIVGLFPERSFIKSETSLLETVSKEKFLLSKFSFIFFQLSSFSKLHFPDDSRKYKSLVICVNYSLKVLVVSFLSLRFSSFSVKIILLLVLHLSLKKGSTVIQNFLLWVI